jgi:hypothetical protein
MGVKTGSVFVGATLAANADWFKPVELAATPIPAFALERCFRTQVSLTGLEMAPRRLAWRSRWTLRICDQLMI